jgi:hypothetical protein
MPDWNGNQKKNLISDNASRLGSVSDGCADQNLPNSGAFFYCLKITGDPITAELMGKCSGVRGATCDTVRSNPYNSTLTHHGMSDLSDSAALTPHDQQKPAQGRLY